MASSVCKVLARVEYSVGYSSLNKEDGPESDLSK